MVTPFSLAEGITFLNCIRILAAVRRIFVAFLAFLFFKIENARQYIRILRHGFSQSDIFIFYTSPGRLWGPPGLTFNWFRVLSSEQSGRDVILTAHLHLAPRLRMSGAIPLLPIYAFMDLSGTALHRRI